MVIDHIRTLSIIVEFDTDVFHSSLYTFQYQGKPEGYYINNYVFVPLTQIQEIVYAQPAE